MRDQSISTATGRLVIGCDANAERAWIELPTEPAATVHLREGELLTTIEALVMTYAELRGARPDSAAHGVRRTLHNRTDHRRKQDRP